jgi:hypothetical protein
MRRCPEGNQSLRAYPKLRREFRLAKFFLFGQLPASPPVSADLSGQDRVCQKRQFSLNAERTVACRLAL